MRVRTATQTVIPRVTESMSMESKSMAQQNLPIQKIHILRKTQYDLRLKLWKRTTRKTHPTPQPYRHLLHPLPPTGQPQQVQPPLHPAHLLPTPQLVPPPVSKPQRLCVREPPLRSSPGHPH